MCKVHLIKKTILMACNYFRNLVAASNLAKIAPAPVFFFKQGTHAPTPHGIVCYELNCWNVGFSCSWLIGIRQSLHLLGKSSIRLFNDNKANKFHVIIYNTY